jgi:hypothetical protein
MKITQAALRSTLTAFSMFNDTTEEAAEKGEIATTAPKGAVEDEWLMASLKRCPDTKPLLFHPL